MGDTERKMIFKFNREDFEEIYFKNNQQSIFWSPGIKADFIVTAVSLPLTILSIIYFSELGRPWFFVFLFGTAFLAGLYLYIFKVRHIIKWKRQVMNYFRQLENVTYHEIVITDEAITDIQDKETSILKWSSFTKAVVNDESITLSGPENFFVPKKAITAADFTYLCEFVTKKMQGE